MVMVLSFGLSVVDRYFGCAFSVQLTGTVGMRSTTRNKSLKWGGPKNSNKLPHGSGHTVRFQIPGPNGSVQTVHFDVPETSS